MPREVEGVDNSQPPQNTEQKRPPEQSQAEQQAAEEERIAERAARAQAQNSRDLGTA